MKWISVKGKLPKEEGEYLCYMESFGIDEEWCTKIDIVRFSRTIKEIIFEENKIVHILNDKMSFEIDTDDYISNKVTHWMPLPEEPNEMD